MSSGVGREQAGSPHVGEQLELVLDDVRSVVVWGGQSPRVLTKAYEKFSLGAPPAGGLHGMNKSAHDVEGASHPEALLLFLKEAKRHGRSSKR